jgi:hypothetical protein
VHLAHPGPGLGHELRLLADRLAALVGVDERPLGGGGGGPLDRLGRGIEGLVAVGAGERQERLLGLGLLPHLAQAEAEQVVGGVEEAVVGELGEQALVQRDGVGVVGLGRRGGGRVGRVERLLVGLLGGEELVEGLLVVELGQPEHGVRGPALVVGVLAQEASSMAMASMRRSRSSFSFMVMSGSYLALMARIFSTKARLMTLLAALR